MKTSKWHGLTNPVEEIRASVPKLLMEFAGTDWTVTQCADCGKRGERTGHQDCQFPQDH